MQRYLAQRLILAFVSLIGLSIIVFVLLRAIPGDAAAILAGDESSMTSMEIDELRTELGLNRPLVVQYLDWAGHLATGDLGASLFTNRPVMESIIKRLPVSVELGMMAVIFAVMIAGPLGILAALRQEGLADQVLRFISILFLALPNFWLGTMVIVFSARWFGWIPPVGYSSFIDDPLRNLQQFLLPAVILGTSLAASLMRMMRSSLLEVMREDYVRTARAKGLSESRTVLRHMLQNAMIPVITVFGLQVGVIIGGTVIIESIFNLPGMGRLVIDTINRRDYPMVQGLIMAFGVSTLIINLLTDLSYAWLDPRISYARKGA